MFCSNCGNQVDDRSMFCPSCGKQFAAHTNAQQPQQYEQQPQQPQQPQQYEQQPYAQQPYAQQPYAQQPYSQQAYSQQNSYGAQQPQGYNDAVNIVQQYIHEASSINVISIVGIILCLGFIGLGCAIASLIKIPKLPVINFPVQDPSLSMQYEDAKRKVERAKTLNIATLVIFGGIFVISFFVGFFGAL